MKNQKKTNDQTIRINKFLSQRGVGSRREVDRWITERRLQIDGSVIQELGYKIGEFKEITLDGVPLDVTVTRKETYAFYKPRQVISTLKDPEGRVCVTDFIEPLKVRLFPIGRLDYDAEGLLLLTNDGDLSEKLAHPRYQKQKTYEVKLKGTVSPETMHTMRKGVKLVDGFAKPKGLKFLRNTASNTWVEMILTEGRNHQIKRMWERLGINVLKILRTEMGPVKLHDLKPGRLRKIEGPEMAELIDYVNHSGAK